MITPRTYQQTIFATAINFNTLVVLPTGLGKTLIAKMLAKYRFEQYKESKILFLTPTKPLAAQHINSFLDTFAKEDMFLALGSTTPEKRKIAYKNTKIIFATPQTIENDIINKRILLENISLIIFDEAHRATGDYSYSFIAKQYEMNGINKRILALTASPGCEKESINNICENLLIEKIEVKKQEDEDIKHYVEETKVTYVELDLPEIFKKIKLNLKKSLDQRIGMLKILDYFKTKSTSQITKRDFLTLNAICMKEISSGNAESNVYQAISLCAQAMKISHAIELLDTQGITPTYKYLEKLWSDSKNTKNKSLLSVVSDPNVKTARCDVISAYEEKLEHPKIEKLKKIVEKEVSNKKDIKIIIFNQYRDCISNIVEELKTIKDVTPKSFVGQAKKNGTGMSQKEQKETINDFSTGKFNVIVMSSVGEEGLDIPSVDLVIFYEPIPSAIRTIQRRGRTGRHSIGKIITLVAKGTIDVAYRWSSHRKEKNMYKVLDNMSGSIQKEIDEINKKSNEKKEIIEIKNKKLGDFMHIENMNKKEIKIICDARENGNLIKELVNLNINCEIKNIGCDFYLSSRCGVERKKIKDFVDSIIDGRLLIQIKDLAHNFSKPLLLLEGEEDIYSVRGIHPNAIRAMLATILISYRIPILYSKTEKESANLLFTIAKREQEYSGSEFEMHFEKTKLTLDDELVYVISSIPGIGTSIAKSLLTYFGSIEKIFFAKEEELMNVKGIGLGLAKKIKEIFTREYSK